MNDLKLDLQKIFRETTETLLNPKEYFSSMSLEGGYAEPIIKAAIYGVVAGLFALLWSLLGFSPMGGGGIWGGAVGVMALIWSVVGAIATAFIGGALMSVISIICGGNLMANHKIFCKHLHRHNTTICIGSGTYDCAQPWRVLRTKRGILNGNCQLFHFNSLSCPARADPAKHPQKAANSAWHHAFCGFRCCY